MLIIQGYKRNNEKDIQNDHNSFYILKVNK